MTPVACWCGLADLSPFGGGYLECACGTLVRASKPDGDITRVTDDDRDVYGQQYWHAHQADLGQPILERRAVLDFRDRCMPWLTTVLAYKRPPARVLEIGAGHGGFLALLAAAGFDSIGIELSPWVVDYATRTSNVRMLRGPLEDQPFEPGTFDLIVAFDVLEHLPDPLGTIALCAKLLQPDGLLILQTPGRPAAGYLALAAGPFGRMLIPEHLYLFSHSSARELLGRAGLPGVEMIPSVFETDVTLVAGHTAPRRLDAYEPLARAMPGGPQPLADALLFFHRALALERESARRRIDTLESEYRVADRDRRERLQRMEEIGAQFAQADRDRVERLQRMGEIGAQLAQADRDRTERLQRIEELGTQLAQADRDRTERLQRMEELGAQLAQADRDRTERLQRIEELDLELKQARSVNHEQQTRLAALHELVGVLRGLEIEAEKERQTLRRQIDDLEAQRTASDEARQMLESRATALQVALIDADAERRAERETLGQQVEHLEARLRDSEDAGRAQDGRLAALQAGLLAADTERREYRQQIRQLESSRAHLMDRHRMLQVVAADHRNSRIYRAMVAAGRWRAHDTRLHSLLDDPSDQRLPRGRDLLARRWTLTTMRARSRDGVVAIDLTAVLPGGQNGGAKLVAIEMVRQLARLAPDRGWLLLTSASCHDELAGLESAGVRRRLVDPTPTALAELVAEETVAALFCPMTTAPFDDPRVPLVCLVHDLQVVTYPEFFSDLERRERLAALEHVALCADRVLTPSGYVRDTLLRYSTLARDHVVAIPHVFAANRLERPAEHDVTEILDRYGIERERYFLYPGNLWPHKNHAMLLVAFSRFCARHPGLSIRLVLPGATHPDTGDVRSSIERLGLVNHVVAPGYIPDAELAALMRGALALVVPSLYEGFGMPLLEAFAAGCPVACSNIASLPEVAGGAALLFDPRRPDAILSAMEQLATQPDLRAGLTQRGEDRLSALRAMASPTVGYLQAIEAVIGQPRRPRTQLAGVFQDQWTTSSFVVAHAGGDATLDLALENPRDTTVTVTTPGNEPVALGPAQGVVLTCTLPPDAGCFEFVVSPVFRPSEDGASSDTRRLGLRVWRANVVAAGGATHDLLAGDHV